MQPVLIIKTMKLKFLGKVKQKGCTSCGGGYSFLPKKKFTLYSQFGIKTFNKGSIYNFENEQEYHYWKNLGYRVNGINYKYFIPL